MSTHTKDQNQSPETPTHDGPEHVHGPNCNHHHNSLAPIVREMPKVGRNEECPCGSKQKFKKCCGK